MTPEDRRTDWDPEQAAELMRLTRNNFSAREIALKLGRTEEAVQAKARLLGLSLTESSSN